MLDIRIGMTPDEVREVASSEGRTEVDMATMMRKEAEERGIAVPEKALDLPPGFDLWTYFDVPEEGNLTTVNFQDGKVVTVSYAANDEAQ